MTCAAAPSGSKPTISMLNAARQHFSLRIKISSQVLRSGTTSMSAPSIFIEGDIVAIKSDGVRIRALPQATHEEGCGEPGEERSARRCCKIRDLGLPVRRKMQEGSRMPAYIQK